MLATVRRGPFARSTQEERIEFLLTRLRKSDCKVTFSDHALEHTLSFQRRVQSIKQEFLRRGATTPLGIPQDYWDRTEAQQRGALHAHILVPSNRKLCGSELIRFKIAIARYGYGSGSHIHTGRRCRRFPGRSKAMVRSRDPSGHHRSCRRRKRFSTILVISSRKWAECRPKCLVQPSHPEIGVAMM